jgi:hypothetical protein
LLWTSHLHSGDCSLKHGCNGTKLCDLVSNLEYFDTFSWFEDWLTRAPRLEWYFVSSSYCSFRT